MTNERDYHETRLRLSLAAERDSRSWSRDDREVVLTELSRNAAKAAKAMRERGRG